MKCQMFITVVFLLLPLISVGKKIGQLKAVNAIVVNATIEGTGEQNKVTGVANIGGKGEGRWKMTYTRAGFDRLFGNHLIIEISSNGTLRVEADRIDPKWFTEGPCLNANFSSSQGWHCYAGIKDADIFYGYLRLEPDGKLNVHAFSVEDTWRTEFKCHSSYQGMPNYCFGATGIKIEACGGYVTSHRTIDYPGYGYYRNYEDCTWILDLQGYYWLRFHMMDLEDCGYCQCDYVTVNGVSTRGDNTSVAFCGHYAPNSTVNLYGPATVEFHSDDSNVGRGFRLSIETNVPTHRPTRRPVPITSTPYPEPIDSDHVRRLHGLDYRMEKLSSNVAKILRILKNIPSTSGIGEVLKDVRQIDSIKKILSGAVIRFPSPTYGDENAVKYYVQGHVEILHSNEWGTLCDDSFDAGPKYGDHNAKVLCRMGGYKSGIYAGGRFKQRNAKKAPRIWLDEVYCSTGEETSIGNCEMRRPWGRHDCNHNEDVGIRCYI